VLPDVAIDHPWSATLDHLHPHSDGGADTADNLAVAHRWCNTIRGDRPLAPARLVLGGVQPPETWAKDRFNLVTRLIDGSVVEFDREAA
jgi:5-methylcytosine-specific restriction endonuclease McrA